MANYTELFIDYLNNGHELPSNFSLIEGFETLFIERYGDCEIGFETEELFAMKLDYKASLVIPEYVGKIALKTNYMTKAANPQKTTTESSGATFKGGAQKTKTTELPLDSSTAQPNLVNDADEFTNTNETELTRTESGGTIDENIRMLEFAEKATRPLIEKCLEEFSDLFMKVY